MNEIGDEDLERVLAQACEVAAGEDFQSVVTVASALRKLAGDEADPTRALIAGLEYHLVLDEERRAGQGAFGPMMEAGGQSYPIPVDQIDKTVAGVYALWERAMRLAPLAMVRSRFADLLWEARYGDRPYEFAQVAIDSYIEAASDDFGHPIERSDGIRRAIELSSMIRDQERHERAVTAAVNLTESAIAAEERMPGVALRLLEVLVNDRPDRRPPNVERLLDDATERFGDDPWNLNSALELQARLIPPEEREGLRERQVQAFLDLAHKSTGLVRYAHLQHAIEIADEHGLRALSEGIRREVETMSEDELDLKEISAEISIPREEVDRFIAWFLGDDDIESALVRFGSYIPTGDPDENREYVNRLMTEHPLQFLVTRITIGPENSLLRSIQSEAEQAEQAMTDHETQRASMFSLFAVEILQAIRAKYGSIAGAQRWFESDLIEATVASKIGRSIEHFEGGDFDSAAAVIAPRLERIVRRIAASVGLTVTRSPDRRGRSGGVKGLGELLGLLQGALPEPTRRYLRVLLSEVTGLNLRNRIGHGLDDEMTEREAALVIHAACHLSLLALSDRPGGEEPEEE